MPDVTPVAVSSSGVDEWLSLGPASRLLGVDPDTLRRWADAGQVEAFATPGGHRRFNRRSLEQLIAVQRRDPLSLSRLGGTTERFAAAYRRGYSVQRRRPAASGAVAAGALTTATATAPAIGPGDEAAFRDEGRRLVEALLGQLDPAAPRARAEARLVSAGLATEMGRRMRATGASLRGAVALFVAARRPFLAEIGAIGRRRHLDPSQLSHLYDEASALLDGLLLAFLDGYQQEEHEEPQP
ncbi:MAG TPA: helix-turn-helix domain-containing protein [Candidatus Limnocylindrales bacterium]|nr:helix-turn-helix domain-containing protein [Candidatus Limnocylindrales bacterium]